MKKVYIVGGVRVPFVKSMTGYAAVTTQGLMEASLKALVEKYHLEGKSVGDVALGAVMLNSADWNLARECVLGAGLHPQTSAYNLQRACGTSLEATNQLALKIASGQIETAIAGGVDTNSDLPVMFSREFAKKMYDLNRSNTVIDKMKAVAGFNLNDLKPQMPVVKEPRTGLSMGEHCEQMVKEWKIDRREQDNWALMSHQSAAKAYKNGFYEDLLIEFKGVKYDALVRGDTSIEKLSKLKPVFDRSELGTLTAGNSSPLTDGSSAVLLASEEAMLKNKWTPLARFVDAEVAAMDFVKGEGLLMAPTLAVHRLLQRNQMKLQDFDYYEIHEAFAGQVLCTLKAWESSKYCMEKLGAPMAHGSIERNKINICGGSVALGHPFAATGARIVASLSKLLNQSGKGRKGLISICTAGGMGVAAILESV